MVGEDSVECGTGDPLIESYKGDESLVIRG